MKISDKRTDILQAALQLIAERGFHASPMAEIAEKAGVAAGTIDRYFENKDILINELHGELEEKINGTLMEAYPLEQSLRERFLYLIRELLIYFIRNPLHFRYMEQYYNSPYGISMQRERFLGKPGKHGIVMEIFKRGVSQQLLKDLPEMVLFSLAFGPLVYLTRDHILGFVALDEKLIERTAEACWDAIKR